MPSHERYLRGTLVHREDGERFTTDGLTPMFRRHCVAANVSDFGLRDLRAKGQPTNTAPVDPSASCGERGNHWFDVNLRSAATDQSWLVSDLRLPSYAAPGAGLVDEARRTFDAQNCEDSPGAAPYSYLRYLRSR